jgi:imidazolonepropionase-like amidohydrolase
MTSAQLTIARTSFIVLITVVGGVLAGTTPLARQAQAGSVALVGGTLIDGTGGRPLPHSVVLIRGDRIEKVGTVATLPVPGGYEAISTNGMTVLPGLWDMHVHLIYSGHPNPAHWFQYASQFETVTIPVAAEQMLMAGVTSVRDLAAPAQAILAVKKRVASGELPGPTMYVAGPALTGNRTGTLPPQFVAISSAADARAKTRQLFEAGVDVIKLFNPELMSPEERRAIVSEAHAHGLKVAAHGMNDTDVRLGLECGVDDFQHLGAEAPEFPADIVAAIRSRVQAGPPLYWTPTVGANGLLNYPYLATKPAFVDDPAGYRGLPAALAADVRKGWAEFQPKPVDPNTAVNVKRKIAQLQQLGVILVFGTDEGSLGELPSQATWMDADLWVHELGMDPMIVLRKMTSDAARAMGVERDVGAVAVGQFADVIAVRGDPLRHIDVLREPRIVIKHGRRYK